ncbi:MAG: response regulator [Thermoplasmata archaeon]|nr:response regulator [Thermoplasmata archaeon]
MKILIIDDEEVICKHLQRELQKEGFTVEYRISPLNVLEDLKRAKEDGEPYSLLFLDIRMPGMDGFELLEEIKKARLNLNVIFITGHGDEEKAIKAIRLGAFDYLNKPIFLKELHTAIYRIKQKMEREKKESFRHHVLVVDDEKNLCDRIKHELDKEGYLVTAIYDSEEGLNYFKNNRVDIVIADLKMPGMSGLEMIKQCREITDNFISIIITGHGDQETAIGALRMSIFDYLKKPFSLEELIISVDKGTDLLLLQRGLSAHKRELEIETAIKKQYADNLEKIVEERTKELQQSYQKLEIAMNATIETMSKIVEVKDPYTAGHQQRVSQLTTAIAKELNLSPDKIEGIRIASLIHDIGKISVPTEILSKSTRLSDIEFSLIKEHSQIGYDILKAIDFSYPVANIVLQHHEKINGSGYPGGLKGDEILLEAKIICVADVVEAMSSHRPYRAALGIDVALEEISQNKGILYDPEVVDTCLRIFKEKGFKFE